MQFQHIRMMRKIATSCVGLGIQIPIGVVPQVSVPRFNRLVRANRFRTHRKTLAVEAGGDIGVRCLAGSCARGGYGAASISRGS